MELLSLTWSIQNICILQCLHSYKGILFVISFDETLALNNNNMQKITTQFARPKLYSSHMYSTHCTIHHNYPILGLPSLPNRTVTHHFASCFNLGLHDLQYAVCCTSPYHCLIDQWFSNWSWSTTV